MKTEAASTATTSTTSTPLKGAREKWKSKDSEIVTSDSISMAPRDMKAFDTTIGGNREEFIAKIKDMCIERDFRVRIPYADRFDRDGYL